MPCSSGRSSCRWGVGALGRVGVALRHAAAHPHPLVCPSSVLPVMCWSVAAHGVAVWMPAVRGAWGALGGRGERLGEYGRRLHPSCHARSCSSPTWRLPAPWLSPSPPPSGLPLVADRDRRAAAAATGLLLPDLHQHGGGQCGAARLGELRQTPPRHTPLTPSTSPAAAAHRLVPPLILRPRKPSYLDLIPTAALWATPAPATPCTTPKAYACHPRNRDASFLDGCVLPPCSSPAYGAAARGAAYHSPAQVKGLRQGMSVRICWEGSRRLIR